MSDPSKTSPHTAECIVRTVFVVFGCAQIIGSRRDILISEMDLVLSQRHGTRLSNVIIADAVVVVHGRLSNVVAIGFCADPTPG